MAAEAKISRGNLEVCRLGKKCLQVVTTALSVSFTRHFNALQRREKSIEMVRYNAEVTRSCVQYSATKDFTTNKKFPSSRGRAQTDPEFGSSG